MTTQQNTLTTPCNSATRLSNSERIAQWRDVAKRIGNAKLINTVDILEALYANEAARPPAPANKGGAQ